MFHFCFNVEEAIIEFCDQCSGKIFSLPQYCDLLHRDYHFYDVQGQAKLIYNDRAKVTY